MVDIVNVEDPEPPLTEAGLNDAEAPLGNPLTLRLTVLLKPPEGVTVTVYAALLFGDTPCEVGVAEREKSLGVTVPQAPL